MADLCFYSSLKVCTLTIVLICSVLFCSGTTEVKHPLPHLDQWRCLAGQCVSRLYPGMGCWVTEQGPGKKFSVINYGFVCVDFSPAQNTHHFLDCFLIAIFDLFRCFFSSWGLTSMITSVKSQRKKNGSCTCCACWRQAGSMTWHHTKGQSWTGHGRLKADLR